MQNKKALTLISLLTIVVLMGAIVITGGAFQENKSNNNTVDESVLSNSTTEPDHDVGEDIVIFSALACPFCRDVEEWVEENKVDEILDLQIKEVSQNQQAADQLTQAAIDCGIDSRTVGVPLMYAKGECFIGKIDIIEYLQLQLQTKQDQENGAEQEIGAESFNETADTVVDNESKIQNENFIED